MSDRLLNACRQVAKRVNFPKSVIFFVALIFGLNVYSFRAYAIFLDGYGYYSLRGETLTNPGFAGNKGTYQAVRQNFYLVGETRLNDRLSFFLGIRLFDDPRSAYLGDTPQKRSQECLPQQTDEQGNILPGEDHSCEHQSTADPRYAPYTPKITEAYAQFAFDYCLLQVGRRSRDWGIGIFQSSGKKPWDTDASIYDGVTCNVNIQKAQALGFSVGWDKLAETGVSHIPNREVLPKDESSYRYGPTNRSDDVDQYFFTIEYDDRKVNAGAAFTKQIGIYFANIVETQSKTDLKYFDLFTGFYFYDLALRNEILFRVNKSGDPSWFAYGGAQLSESDDAPNRLDSIGLAGDLSYTISKQGAAIGPSEYREGNIEAHIVFMEYAYAPGDADGYYNVDDDSATPGPISIAKRNNKVATIAFHRNYKPAMIFFNGGPEIDDLKVDGVFDPARVMNASLLALGYRYESYSIGNIEAKLITARLLQKMPAEVMEYYSDKDQRPMGFWGKQQLGYELDLNYRYFWGKEVEAGLGAAAALPQKTWQTLKGESPTYSLLLRADLAFKF